ncbi:MAG: rRNA pseudouridine synthase [Ruminococcaceae bacterium]|nr:rRNA pseudouridine synthase [Oscillospiraceae bacterium]
MNERLQKILSARGVASRRKAEEIILQGRVTVNGIIAALGDSADPSVDTIEIDNKPLPELPDKVYIMLNKPRGYVTTLSDEKGRKTASSLVEDCGARVYPVGRLDMDSEGLLLFTNDGEAANKLMHPGFEKNKTYLVTVKGEIDGKVAKLEQPMNIDGYITSGAEVKVHSKNPSGGKLYITIHEGRNRQVRKMCDSVGLIVIRLVRIEVDGVKLGMLPPGKWRYLTGDEIKTLGIL